jgi:hypothetical protein
MVRHPALVVDRLVCATLPIVSISASIDMSEPERQSSPGDSDVFSGGCDYLAGITADDLPLSFGSGFARTCIVLGPDLRLMAGEEWARSQRIEEDERGNRLFAGGL